MISRSFLRSSLIFTAGGALPMLASFLLLPFYTNYLTDLNYARLLFYISISAISQILFSFATDSYFGVQYSQLHATPDRQRTFVHSTSVLLLITGGVLMVILSLIGQPLFGIIFNEELHIDFWPYGFISILTGFFNSYFKTASICLIYVSKPGRFFFYNSLNFLFTVVFSVGGLFLFPGGLEGPIGGRLVSGLVIFFCARQVFAAEGNGKTDRSFFPEFLAFSVPYVVYGISVWVLTQVDRYLLQQQEISGLNSYDLVVKCFFGIEFLQNSLLAVIFPKVYEIWSKNGTGGTTTESNRYFNVFTIVNIVQILLFCIVLPWLYQLLIAKDYFYAGLGYLGVIAAGYAVRSIVSFYLAAVLYTKSTRLMLTIFLSTAILQVVLTWLFVKDYGIAGAVYAGVAIKLLQGAAFAVFTPNVFNIRFNWFKILGLPVLFLLVNVLHYFFAQGYDLLFFVLQLVLFGVIILFLFKKEFTKVVRDFLAARPS